MFVFQKEAKDFRLAIAVVHPEEHFYLKNMKLSALEKKELFSIKFLPRRMEWLSVRYLLHQITGAKTRIFLEKDEFGKPHLVDNQEGLLRYISISHSKHFVAALISSKPCGCDVQVLSPKIERIAPKFLAQAEKQMLVDKNPAERLHVLNVIWSAKESLYKAYGRKALEFREHLGVHIQHDALALGTVQKGAFHQKYDVHIHDFKDENEDVYVFTWCIEL